MKIVYEDNHLLVALKDPGEIVQGDKTGDQPMSEKIKLWLKEKYNKPGNVFCGVVHRLDRPVGGLVIFAKTSKALSRLNEMLRQGKIHKTYWAITRNKPPRQADTLTHYITTRQENNKSYASNKPVEGALKSQLEYKHIASSDRYNLLEIKLLTGRKHQIRVQLAKIGCPIKGDLKYGDKRSNPDGSISLQAHHLEFVHPVSGNLISLTAPVPDDNLWNALSQSINQ